MSGLFAIGDVDDAGPHIALGLHGLQHLGTEGVGITTTEKEQFHTKRDLGLVGYVFGENSSRASTKQFERLRGRWGIGHVKSSTARKRERTIRNIQPYFAEISLGRFAIAFTGNLTNATELKQDLQDRGAIFKTDLDAEIIVHLIAHSSAPTFEDRLISALKLVSGAFSLVVLTAEGIIGIRDPFGFRPLILGQMMDCGAWILASESCALDIIRAKYNREIDPGEMIIISSDGIKVYRPFKSEPRRSCMFVNVHLARQDSVCNGKSASIIRTLIGEQLAHECPVEADVVIPVPDSGAPAAIGFSSVSSIPYALWITLNHYMGSKFTEPDERIRDLGLRLKYNVCRIVVKEKRVVIIDDSILRGTTAKKIAAMLKAAGASEVHFRFACPPVTDSCHWGVNIPDEGDLIASYMSVEEMCKWLGADSLAFISVDGLYKAVTGHARSVGTRQYCDACFTGGHPIFS